LVRRVEKGSGKEKKAEDFGPPQKRSAKKGGRCKKRAKRPSRNIQLTPIGGGETQKPRRKGLSTGGLPDHTGKRKGGWQVVPGAEPYQQGGRTGENTGGMFMTNKVIATAENRKGNGEGSGQNGGQKTAIGKEKAKREVNEKRESSLLHLREG